MWLDEANGIAELFRGYLPYYLFVALPMFIIMSPVNPVAASHEFTVYRLRQYDLHSVPHGCRSSSFNLEGRSLTSYSSSRHCLVARIQDINAMNVKAIWTTVGALVLVLPKNDTILTQTQIEGIRIVETSIGRGQVNPVVYFIRWSPDIENIIQDLEHNSVPGNDKSGTALEAMFNTVSSNGYQIAVSAPTPYKLDSTMMTLHGKLVGRTGSAQTIIITTQYDSSTVVPELSLDGADCNASGVVALLELARIFSRLYSSAALRGGPSLLFLLTSMGQPLNYIAAKKWLEEQLESADTSFRQDVAFVLNLDILSHAKMTMHVSKPPQPGSAMHSFNSRLGVPIEHKKIQLGDEYLAWQHERFSIRRMAAFTLSTMAHHTFSSRHSMVEFPSNETFTNIKNHIARTARALASYVYNLTQETYDEDAALFDDALTVDEESIKYWYKYLTSLSRSAEVITTVPPSAGVTGALERALSRYMDVTVSTYPVDKREPEYTLYGPTHATLYVYSVKPAVFDLILTLVIAAYLTVVYFALQLFPRFYEEYARMVTGKMKVQ